MVTDWQRLSQELSAAEVIAGIGRPPQRDSDSQERYTRPLPTWPDWFFRSHMWRDFATGRLRLYLNPSETISLWSAYALLFAGLIWAVVGLRRLRRPRW